MNFSFEKDIPEVRVEIQVEGYVPETKTDPAEWDRFRVCLSIVNADGMKYLDITDFLTKDEIDEIKNDIFEEAGK